jgi:hypothetical protein
VAICKESRHGQPDYLGLAKKNCAHIGKQAVQEMGDRRRCVPSFSHAYLVAALDPARTLLVSTFITTLEFCVLVE